MYFVFNKIYVVSGGVIYGKENFVTKYFDRNKNTLIDTSLNPFSQQLFKPVLPESLHKKKPNFRKSKETHIKALLKTA